MDYIDGNKKRMICPLGEEKFESDQFSEWWKITVKCELQINVYTIDEIKSAAKQNNIVLDGKYFEKKPVHKYYVICFKIHEQEWWCRRQRAATNTSD